MTAPDTPVGVPIRIGTRGSALALVQARWVEGRITQAGLTAELVLIRTAGDDRAPDTAWGEGAFVSAIERALLDRRIDVAVHSAKDVPTDEDPRLVISAWTVREDPRDSLVCRVRGTTLATLPQGARVGTDSPRRGAFLRSVRPDLVIHTLSGNVDTRLRKLFAGESDALVLAVAGLTRLGHADWIDEILPLDIAVPAPGQGALALQTRADDVRTGAVIAGFDILASRVAVEAERAFLGWTGGGCRSPIGALGTVEGLAFTLQVAAERTLPLPGGAMVRGGVVRFVAHGPLERSDEIARVLAERVVQARTRARVLLTRPLEGAEASVTVLGAAGFAAVAAPTIEICDETPGGPLDAAVGALTATAAPRAWLVATSPNGVRVALDALDRHAIPAASVRWAVAGRASAARLAPRGIDPFTPRSALGRALVEELPMEPGDRVLLVRGDLADPGLATTLAARGAQVTEVVGYQTHEGPESARAGVSAALEDPVDALAFASGSAARGLLALAPSDARARLLTLPAVCIGPTTAEVARSLGFVTVVEAADTTPEALVHAVAAVLQATLPPVPDESSDPLPLPPMPQPTVPGAAR